MPEEKLLNVREAAAFLRMSEKEVIDLSEQGIIPAYKVGGVYLRFKKDQLNSVKLNPQVLGTGTQVKFKDDAPIKASIIERIDDFLYFNDFYFLCFVICALLLLLVFST